MSCSRLAHRKGAKNMSIKLRFAARDEQGWQARSLLERRRRREGADLRAGSLQVMLDD
jgi:hypothetical protein